MLLDLFWANHLNYLQRFKLALFVWNNPLPRKIFWKWLIHRNMLRDQSAVRHIMSLFSDWDNNKNLHYFTFSVAKKEFETLRGDKVKNNR